jgi:hypothetical protein
MTETAEETPPATEAHQLRADLDELKRDVAQQATATREYVRRLEDRVRGQMLPGKKGAKGDAGPKGDRGEPGPRGAQGERGPQGDKGPRGEQGRPGQLWSPVGDDEPTPTASSNPFVAETVRAALASRRAPKENS